MKLGFVTAILPDLSLEEIIEFAASEGFSCVEVMCWPKGKAERRYAGVTHLDVSDLNNEKAESTLQMMNEAGVELSGLGYYPNLLAPEKEEAMMPVVSATTLPLRAGASR